MDKNELEYFQHTLTNLNEKIKTAKHKLQEIDIELENSKQDLSDNYHEVSHAVGDLGARFERLDALQQSSIDLSNTLNRLNTQRKTPYFSRIDFLQNGTNEKIYIGLGTIMDGNRFVVYDWRAPISSMYYDYGIGKASYKVGKKEFSGEITLKRQYKIENDTLVSYFDTNLAIEDEILRDVLSKNSSAKMKQIVSSIQQEQNVIVRTEEFDNLLVQGVAGSGKTSIALHRAAYLLYEHRDQLKSSDILIMSPNNVFSSYISDVLPQLGEENLVETSYDQIARIELKKPLQSREKMLDEIAERPTQEMLNEISYKASFEYMGDLIKFLRGDFLETFSPQTLRFIVNTKVKADGSEEKKEEVFSAEDTQDLFFNNLKNLTIAERINKIAWQYAMYFTEKRGYNKEQNRGLRERFKALLYNFLPIKDIFKVFEIFCARVGLAYNNSDEIGYMDKGALLIIKDFIYGFDHDFGAKYLIIDEMQDFTPVDFYVFKKLWTCPSIILGDINQCIEKTLSRSYLNDISSFLGTELIELKKTYRSTKQIAEFAHNMIGLDGVEYVNRDGQEPRLYKNANVATTIKDIIENECDAFAHTAIICKCEKELRGLEKELRGVVDFHVLNEPEDYNNKILLTTCATAKGIEFDCVIIPNADEINYRNNIDKNILYVSSTRALHKLFFVSTSEPSKFLAGIKDVK